MIGLKEYDDGKDGILFIAEGEQNIPFDIKRVYFITNLTNQFSMRGMHAHRELKQVIFCLRGVFELELYNGDNRESYLLKNPKEGISIPPLYWHTMRNFSSDCLICVFASDYYKESDYIRDFTEFKRLVK